MTAEAPVWPFSDTRHSQIVWTLRVAARRERNIDPEARRLLDPTFSHWRAFAGGLHDGDFVKLLIENTAALNPLALRPMSESLSAAIGKSLLDEALTEQPALLRSASATFLEAAAVAFGKEPLGDDRRRMFEAVRSQEQRILELPSTAARVSSAVAAPGAPLETYVGYIVNDDVDIFLVGLTMLEFDRNASPVVAHVDDLRAGKTSGMGTFTRAASLGGEDEILALLPPGTVARVVTL